MSKINSAYNFLFHPLHKDDPRKHDHTKRALTLIASIAAGIFSLSISHITVFAMHKYRERKIEKHPAPSAPSPSHETPKEAKDPFKLANSTSSSSESSTSDEDARLARKLQAEEEPTANPGAFIDEDPNNPFDPFMTFPDELAFNQNAPPPSYDEELQFALYTSILSDEEPEVDHERAKTYLTEVPNEETLKEGIRLLAAAANGGSSEAQYQFAEIFKEGFPTIQKNPSLARHYYKLAAEQGHTQSKIQFGYCLEHGIGGAIDLKQAEKWYKQGAKEKDPLGQYLLGSLLAKRDKKKGIKYLKLSAEQNFPTALTALGACYLKGQLVDQDYDLAEENLLKATEYNSGLAHFYLGELYETAEGKIDIERAFKHYAEAHTLKQYDAALAKLKELKGDDQLELYFRKAANLNLGKAFLHLARGYESGIFGRIDPNEALKYYIKAALRGNADAQYWLGKCYMEKEKNDIHTAQAKLYLKKAAEQGHEQAKIELEKLPED